MRQLEIADWILLQTGLGPTVSYPNQRKECISQLQYLIIWQQLTEMMNEMHIILEWTCLYTEVLNSTVYVACHNINIWVLQWGLTFTPSLTRLWTWFGLRGALLSQMLVSSLLMPNTLPRPHPVLRWLVDEVNDRWRQVMWLQGRCLHCTLILFELHLRLEAAVIGIRG